MEAWFWWWVELHKYFLHQAYWPLDLAVANFYTSNSAEKLFCRILQGSAKKWYPGSVKMKRKNCVLLPAAGRRTQFFTSYSQNLRPIFSPSPVEWWATAPQLSKRLRTFSTDKQESGKHGWRIICISTCILTVLLRNLSRLFIIIYIFVMALVNAIKYTFNMKIFHKSCAFFFLFILGFNLW